MYHIIEGATTPGQVGPESNGKEEIIHTLQIFRTGSLASGCCLVLYSLQNSFLGEALLRWEYN